MNAPLNITALLTSMDALLRDHPELADDDTLKADMLEGCTTAFEALAVLLDTMQETTALMTGLNERIKEMRLRRDRLEMREEACRRLMQRIMEHAQLSKVALPEATLSLRATPESVEITDFAEIPDEFCRYVREVSKTKVKEALKAGTFVPGAVLSNGGQTVSVRTK